MNGHFLRPTTSAKSISWVSTIVLGEKNLAPSKVGQTENFQTCLMDYNIPDILAMCRRNTPMLFFGQVACLQTLFHFSFLFVDVCWLDDKVKVLFGKFSSVQA